MSFGNYNKTAVPIIINALKAKGINDNGICGILGNMYAESGLYPNNLQNTYNKKIGMTDDEYTIAVDNGLYTNFAHDSAGYGLCQWTSSGRKQGLYDYCKKLDVSIADINAQCDWLYIELSKSYKAVFNELISPTNSVDSCARIFMVRFEVPAKRDEEHQRVRVSYAEEFFDKYFKGNIEEDNNACGDGYVMSCTKFIEKLKYAASCKTLYIMGCFGAPMNAKNKERYKHNHSYNANPQRQSMIDIASPDTFGFDCVNLIKGILWGWCGDTTKVYGGAIYKANDVPDIGADTMAKRYLKNVTTDFTQIQPGWAVWMSGHIGVYIGEGRVIECTPKWENDVQYSWLGNLPEYRKGNYREWTSCGRIPWIDYSGSKKETHEGQSKDEGSVMYTVVSGDTLTSIARKFGTTVDQIVAWNKLKYPSLVINKNFIYKGWVLKVK